MTKTRKPRVDSPRHYDYYGRPVTGLVTVQERVTHSQVWSRRSARNMIVNRWDDLEGYRLTSKPQPAHYKPRHIVRFQSRGDVVTRVS